MKKTALIAIILMAVLCSPLIDNPAHAEIRTIHQDLTVSLNPAQRSLVVSAKLDIEGQGQLMLRLSDTFEVTGFTVDGKKTAVKRMGDRWMLKFRDNRRHYVTLKYHGILAPSPVVSGPFGLAEPVSSIDGSFLPAGSAWVPSFNKHKFSYRLDIRVPDA